MSIKKVPTQSIGVNDTHHFRSTHFRLSPVHPNENEASSEPDERNDEQCESARLQENSTPSLANRLARHGQTECDTCDTIKGERIISFLSVKEGINERDR